MKLTLLIVLLLGGCAQFQECSLPCEIKVFRWQDKLVEGPLPPCEDVA